MGQRLPIDDVSRLRISSRGQIPLAFSIVLFGNTKVMCLCTHIRVLETTKELKSGIPKQKDLQQRIFTCYFLILTQYIYLNNILVSLALVELSYLSLHYNFSAPS